MLVSGAYKQKEQLVTNSIVSYFVDLQFAIKEMEPTVLSNECVNSTLNIKLYEFLCAHFVDFDKALKLTLHTHVEPLPVNTTIPKRTFKSKIYKLISNRSNKSVLMEIYRGLHGLKVFFSKKPISDVSDVSSSNDYFRIVDVISALSIADINILAKNIVTFNTTQITNALDDIEQYDNQALGKKKCIVISTLFVSTWMPTFNALAKNGWSICSVLKDDLRAYTGYGALTTDEIETGHIYFHGFIGAVLFATTASANTPVLLSGECYHGVHMFADSGIFMNLNLSCITNVIRKHRPAEHKNLYFFMYDGLKPVFRNCHNVKQESSKYYRRFMKNADKIIYNSNGEVFGDYVENAFGIEAPRLHFGRYSVGEISKVAKKNEDIHVVSITAIFDPSNYDVRTTTKDMVRCIVEQGMHFHCYTGEEKQDSHIVEQFIESIKPEFRKNFHIHDVIRDQVALVKEIQKYDVGMNGADHLQFSKGIIDLNDRPYSDGMMMYLQSTFATSFFVYAAAGLPILIPRCMTKATEYFGKFAIPICLSEFANIKNILVKANLPELYSDVERLQKLAIVDEHIGRLINFLSPVDSDLNIPHDVVAAAKEDVVA